ncbi:MAG: restriction endonuclease subunit S, partial [Oscillospiraceae bacterium]|nr:restriction endonuclease subunit S [Oscillospiraceae bacterium]
MREMKDSGVEWIGEIPADWNVTILSALFGERRHKNAGLTERNLLSLSYGKVIKKDIDSNEGLLPASFEAYNVIECGDIVLRLTDLQNDKRSLRTGLCAQRGIITSAYTTLAIRSDDDPAYMHYLLHAYDICKVFYGMGDGVRQGMNYSDLKSLRIIRPSLAEQKRIADFLDTKCTKIDAIITRQQQVIEKLKAYKLSVITEAVTRGLNPDVPMKDSGIEWVDEIPAHWENRKMLSILAMRVVDGPHESPVLFDTGIPYISATAIVDGKIDFNQMRGYISKEYCDVCDRRYAPQLNDILIVKLGASTGQVALVETTERFNIWVPLAAVR